VSVQSSVVSPIRHGGFELPAYRGNDRVRRAFEAADTLWIPAEHVLARQKLRLFAYGIARREAVEAAHDAVRD
jgi:hypothetical protein